MPEQINLVLRSGEDWLSRACHRHDLLDRIGRCCTRQSVTWLAWGLSETELRLVIDGGMVGRMVRGVKVGTISQARACGQELRFYTWDRVQLAECELERAVAWAHRVHADPLATPWSSHRDLMGYRRSAGFSVVPLLQRVRPLRVHQLAGGTPLPRPGAPTAEDLNQLMDVAAAVQGRAPGDPRAFPLFVHMGKELGWTTRKLADALAVSPRRVRQLGEKGVEDWIGLAWLALGDRRLQVAR